ncbi:MAG: heme exporter protein CcmD [Kiloniellales bacterium]
MIGFFEMGGYAGFVWPSFGITALVMIGLLVVSLRELRSRERTLAVLEAARPKRRRRGSRDGAGEHGGSAAP